MHLCPCLQKGEVLPSEPRFDSNCITPGTDFMARLHEHLKYFVNKKLSSDPTWQKVEIILSGHDVGQIREREGERERRGERGREGEKDVMLSRLICGGDEKAFQNMFYLWWVDNAAFQVTGEVPIPIAVVDNGNHGVLCALYCTSG